MYRLILLIALVPAIFATTGVRTCSGIEFPNSVQIVGCDAEPCTMIRGETGVTIVNFTAPFDFETFEPAVKATIGLIVVDYALPEATRIGCNNLIEGGDTQECPIKAGETVMYQLIQEVDPDSPTLFSPVLKFTLFDQDKNAIVCYEWTAKIV